MFHWAARRSGKRCIYSVYTSHELRPTPADAVQGLQVSPCYTRSRRSLKLPRIKLRRAIFMTSASGNALSLLILSKDTSIFPCHVSNVAYRGVRIFLRHAFIFGLARQSSLPELGLSLFVDGIIQKHDQLNRPLPRSLTHSRLSATLRKFIKQEPAIVSGKNI